MSGSGLGLLAQETSCSTCSTVMLVRSCMTSPGHQDRSRRERIRVQTTLILAGVAFVGAAIVGGGLIAFKIEIRSSTLFPARYCLVCSV